MTDRRISTEEVAKLAELVRISISGEETEKLATDLGKIIEYISILDTAPTTAPEDLLPSPVENVMRLDGEPHDSGVYRDLIIANFPNKKGDYLAVKEILSREDVN